ncbi:MAG: hypothetical protein OCD76_03200 [Reichenbachiella sp.]
MKNNFRINYAMIIVEFQSSIFPFLTHITTNLNSSEIEKIYGNRVHSRMRETFNVIAFDANTIDKRP